MIVQRRTFSATETYQWTSRTLSAARTALDEFGFNEIVPAILSSELEPGAFHSFGVLGNRIRPEYIELDGREPERQVQVTGKEAYYLPVSHNFEKQQATEFLDRVYCLAPCVRLLQEGEAASRKHLNTFFQMEIEWKTESMEDVFDTAQALLVRISNILLSVENGPSKLTSISKKHLEAIALGNYPRITFQEALQLVEASPERLSDLTFDEDQSLSLQFDRPFWIYNYPKGVRDAVYHENDQGNYDTYDLMLPFGYGELSTGGIRPKTGEAIIQQSLDNLGEAKASLTMGHAEWKRARKIQTAGFGIGFERLLRFVSGSTTVLDFVQPHDRGPNRTIPGMASV
ncbi:amino acid--tRNA ligase-related protein [Phyllobacterium sp. YR531]|uniref:amino acid--tRNA ligase-related protein n=1 Tax=Phyllobacterium sp. YR531 TaxID=1144343 RepID=UPI00026FC404|nr:amino acid--tRNA ligase-related protein [Phyllobacterium sp. YR531]EJM99425.1 aspartyl/asparaginyl-tRNA synthetase [Phyllobacterium sp. YR531]